MQDGMHGEMCKCPHHKMGPLLITLIGLVFLLRALGVVDGSFADVAWPILLMLVGIHKMSAGSMCSCCGPKQ